MPIALQALAIVAVILLLASIAIYTRSGDEKIARAFKDQGLPSQGNGENHRDYLGRDW